MAFQNRHLVLAQAAYLQAIQTYLENNGGSRGSYLVMDKAGAPVLDELGDAWRYKPENSELRETVLVTHLNEKAEFESRGEARRPIPTEDYWFENVWADFRSKAIFQK